MCTAGQDAVLGQFSTAFGLYGPPWRLVHVRKRTSSMLKSSKQKPSLRISPITPALYIFNLCGFFRLLDSRDKLYWGTGCKAKYYIIFSIETAITIKIHACTHSRRGLSLFSYRLCPRFSLYKFLGTKNHFPNFFQCCIKSYSHQSKRFHLNI